MQYLKLADCGVDHAAAVLAETVRRPGAVALVPTETVYGLIGRADDPAVRERICLLKHRESGKKMGWFVADWRQLDRFGIRLTGVAATLAARFWPGPLTLIVPRADGDTIGLRLPAFPLFDALKMHWTEPLWQTSANRAGAPDARSCAEALAELDGEVDLAIDGGRLAKAVGSTVVNTCGGELQLLRQGALHLPAEFGVAR